MSSFLHTLNFISFNVHGNLELKLGMHDFVESLNGYNCVFFTETWSNECSDLELKGFAKPVCKHRKRKKNGKRDSGGVCMYFKEELDIGIEHIGWDFEDGLLFKLKKDFFGWEKDLYLMGVYMRSTQSTREDLNDNLNCYDKVLEKLAEIPEDSMIVAMGDWNARIGEREECSIITGSERVARCSEIEGMLNENENVFFKEDFVQNDLSLVRTNQDKKINEYGLKLLSLCNTADLCILNGRSFGDKDIGAYTYFNNQGKSAIDFIMCNNHALKYVCDFNVHLPNIFSDHCVIDFSLNYNVIQTQTESSVDKGTIRLSKWKEERKTDYIYAINSEETYLELENLISEIEEASCGEIVEDKLKLFTDIIVKAGAGHIREISGAGVSKTINGGQEWYDKQCKEKHDLFKEYEIRFHETNLDEDRVAMCQQRNEYRKLCRDKKRELNQIEADRLVGLSKKDPRSFWREIKGAKGSKGNMECNFFDHFCKLANVDSTVGEEGKAEVEGQAGEDNLRKHDSLDKCIDMKELEGAIKGLKRNKSAGEDNILNEFLVNASLAVKIFILIIFNKLLDLEYFPKTWATGKITPVFKKGDNTDPNNYRGITILSCLSKLFTKNMNERLNRWAEEEKTLTDTQYGFRKNRGTTDCVFILKGLIDIVFARGLKLYVCFVDYQKAYDLLDRSCLFYKLAKEGVSSKCVNLFKDLYSKMKLKVVTDEKHRSFASNVGLLQGESSSPILFSLFVNDLEQSLIE